MKAAFFKEHGGAEKILYDDYRDPAPGAGEVIVRVQARPSTSRSVGIITRVCRARSRDR